MSFLDAMTCGFGAVLLVFTVITAASGVRQKRETIDRRAEVNRLEEQVLEGHKNLVRLRNSLREVEDETVLTRGLSRRVLEVIEEIRAELATYEQSTLAKREHVNRLKTDLATLEKETKRLSALAVSDETPGRNVRNFVGDGDRQYLTGLKVGGSHVLILLDASASMLGSTIVNVVRRRNLSAGEKRRSPKWQQAVRTVDWLTTQLPLDSRYQIFTFAVEAKPLVPDTGGQWLETRDRQRLDAAVARLRQVVPSDGTSLQLAFAAIKTLSPLPDNVILITDGLPTQGATPPRAATVTGKQRLQLYNRSLREVPSRLPINVILLPMEGDPLAASAFWQLAIATGGSYLSPAEDWP
jgi:hypothetical protein